MKRTLEKIKKYIFMAMKSINDSYFFFIVLIKFIELFK